MVLLMGDVKNGSRNLHLSVSNKCRIIFSPSNSSAVMDAYYLERSDWNQITNKCGTSWKAMQEMTTISLIKSGEFSKAVDYMKKTSKSDEQHLKVVVLLGYNLIGMHKMAQFCSMLSSNVLRVQCFTNVIQRVTIYRELQNVEMLNFWFLMIKSEPFMLQPPIAELYDNSKNDIISQIVDEIQCSFCQRTVLKKFVNLENATKLHFVPDIVLKYHNKGYNWKSFLYYVTYNLVSIACSASHEVFLLFERTGHLESIEALVLRRSVQISLQIRSNHNEGIRISLYDYCEKVDQELQTYSPVHALPFLKLFDEKKFDELKTNYLTPAIIDELVNARYNISNMIDLTNFLWDDPENLEIACVGSFALVNIMKSSGQLRSIEALSLFSHINKHGISYVIDFNEYWAQKCLTALSLAPDLVKYYMLSCKCCKVQEPFCSDALIDGLVPLLQDSDKFKNYPREILFIGYVINISSTATVSKDLAIFGKSLNDSFNLVFNSIMLSYEEDTNMIFDVDVNSLNNWFNIEIYHHYLRLLIVRATKTVRSHLKIVRRHIQKFYKRFNLVCESLDVFLIPELVEPTDQEQFMELSDLLHNYCKSQQSAGVYNIESPFNIVIYNMRLKMTL